MNWKEKLKKATASAYETGKQKYAEQSAERRKSQAEYKAAYAAAYARERQVQARYAGRHAAKRRYAPQRTGGGIASLGIAQYGYGLMGLSPPSTTTRKRKSTTTRKRRPKRVEYY